MDAVIQNSAVMQKLTDSELYQKCQEIGGLCRKYRNQFLGMLPEVMARKLFLKHGMSSIYEFAAKLACVSRDTVNEVLRIHQHLETAPLLQKKLVTGEIGYTKLRAVATIVKPETQKLWLEKVECMSKPTLEVYVQELKQQQGHIVTSGQMRLLPGKESDVVPFSVKIKSQTLAKMRVMKERLEKKLKKPMNWDEAFEEIIKILDEDARRRRRKITLDKHVAAKRYIPAHIRHEVEDHKSGICDFPSCTKPGQIFHHLNRFALDARHESKTIVHLCKAHEQIAHQSLIGGETGALRDWKVLMNPEITDHESAARHFIDQLVQQYR